MSFDDDEFQLETCECDEVCSDCRAASLRIFEYWTSVKRLMKNANQELDKGTRLLPNATKPHTKSVPVKLRMPRGLTALFPRNVR